MVNFVNQSESQPGVWSQPLLAVSCSRNLRRLRRPVMCACHPTRVYTNNVGSAAAAKSQAAQVSICTFHLLIAFILLLI